MRVEVPRLRRDENPSGANPRLHRPNGAWQAPDQLLAYAAKPPMDSLPSPKGDVCEADRGIPSDFLDSDTPIAFFVTPISPPVESISADNKRISSFRAVARELDS